MKSLELDETLVVKYEGLVVEKYDPDEPRDQRERWTASGMAAEALEAVKNTPGAQVSADGIDLDVARWQDPDQAGEESVRTGVFFTPELDQLWRPVPLDDAVLIKLWDENGIHWLLGPGASGEVRSTARIRSAITPAGGRARAGRRSLRCEMSSRACPGA